MRTIVISRPPAPLNHPQFSAARRYPVLMQEPARFWARAGTCAVQRLDASGPAVSGAAAVVLDLHDRLSGAADGASHLA